MQKEQALMPKVLSSAVANYLIPTATTSTKIEKKAESA